MKSMHRRIALWTSLMHFLISIIHLVFFKFLQHLLLSLKPNFMNLEENDFYFLRAYIKRVEKVLIY